MIVTSRNQVVQEVQVRSSRCDVTIFRNLLKIAGGHVWVNKTFAMNLRVSIKSNCDDTLRSVNSSKLQGCVSLADVASVRS